MGGEKLSQKERIFADHLALDVFFHQKEEGEVAELEAMEGNESREAIIQYVKSKVAVLQQEETTKTDEEKNDELVEKTVELARIILDEQYPQMVGAIEHYQIETSGAPSKKMIERRLTQKVLQKAIKLEKPTLLLIAPIPMSEKVSAMNSFRAKDGKFYDVELHFDIDPQQRDREDRDELEGDEGPTRAKRWKAAIVEGMPEIGNRVMPKPGWSVSRLVNEMKKKYRRQGLSIMSDIHEYLTLVLKVLAENSQHIDEKVTTVLSQARVPVPRNTYPIHISLLEGNWEVPQKIRIGNTYPTANNYPWQVRPMVKLKI